MRTVLSLVPLVLSTTAWATTDDELSDAAQMKLSAVERELGKFDPNTRPWADGENPETAERVMYNTEVVLGRMRGWLDAVPADQRDAPRVVAAREDVDTLAAALESWQADAASWQDNARISREGHRAFMDAWAAYDTPHSWVVGWRDRPVDSPSPERMMEAWDEGMPLDALAEACRTTHAEYLAMGRHPSDVAKCDVAENWRPILKEAFGKALRDSVDLRVRMFESSVRDMTERGETHEDTIAKMASADTYIAEQRERYAPVVQLIDGELPEDLFARLPAAATAFQSAFAAAQTQTHWTGGSTDGDAGGALQRAVSGAGLSVLATALPTSEWTEEGAHRFRDGLVLARDSGDSYCRIYELSATSERTPTSWTRATVSFDHETRPFQVTACP